jgi:peptidoglycan/LPS O-acetylase OafA/YrhL
VCCFVIFGPLVTDAANVRGGTKRHYGGVRWPSCISHREQEVENLFVFRDAVMAFVNITMAMLFFSGAGINDTSQSKNSKSVLESLMALHPQVRQIDALTGLRAVAALWVMLYHFQSYKMDQVYSFGIADPLTTKGGLGVDLFFILSGFIMLHVYAASFHRQVNGSNYSEFLIYRIARLYPVHVFTLGIMLALATASTLVGGRAPLHPEMYSGGAMISNLLLIHAWFGAASPNMPAWSISAEWFAYLLFPALCYWIQTNRYIPAIYCVVAVAALAILPGPIVHIPLVQVMIDFVMGMAILRILDTVYLPKITGACAISTIVILLYCAPESGAIMLVVMAILIAALARGQDYFGGALSHPIAVYIGEISYSLYMVHWPVRAILREVFAKLAPAAHPLLIIPAYCAATLIAAAATYHLVEVPGRRMIRRLSVTREEASL